MSTNITLKRSSVQGRVPLTTDLALGEIALNTYDGKLFIKKNVGGTETIIDVTAPTLTGVVTSSNNVTSFTALAVDNAAINILAVTSGKIYPKAITTGKIDDAAVTPAQIKIKAVVALADAAATLSATQMVDSGIFTITPTVARNLTTANATSIIAQLPDYQVGTWFDFTIVNLAAFVVTLVANTGVTRVGSATMNNASGTWKCLVTSSSAVTIYRT